MAQMKALRKEGASVLLASVPRPTVEAPDDVIIQVAAAGVCRTDIYVAEGRLPCRDPLILGHELSGLVTQAGSAAGELRPGDLVTVAPLWACRSCGGCAQGGACERPEMLGVQRHGAFAEFLKAPAAAVYRVPAGLSARAAAYAEPVAAALAVLKAGLHPGERGLIYGTSRIARLVQRVLAAAGLGDVPIYDPAAAATGLPHAAFDYVIETIATTASLAEMLPAVRVGGRIVLKSRPPEPALLPVAVAVLREISFISVAYGSFSDALRWLAEGRLPLADLLGEAYPLTDFAQAFAAAQGAEARKIFLSPAAELAGL